MDDAKPKKSLLSNPDAVLIAGTGVILIAAALIAVFLHPFPPPPGCLPPHQTAAVARVLDHGSEWTDGTTRVVVALRRRDGTVTTCLGGHENAALAAGDVVDGHGLHPAI